MKKSIAIFSVIAILSAVSCEREAVRESGAVRFQAGIGTLQTKATDDAFEAGDAIGIYALDPVGVQNVKATLDEKGQVNPVETIHWGHSQGGNEPVRFFAYYPYMEDANLLGNGFTFAVQEDQSSHESLTASDLMFADIWASPADGVVPLNFIHQLCQILVVVDDRVDAGVTGVSLEGFRLRTQIRFNDGLYIEYSDGDPAAIKACPVEYGNSTAWALIVPPQWFNAPEIHLSTKNAGDIDLTTLYGNYANMGQRHILKVVLDESFRSATFSEVIYDWLEGDEIVCTEPKDTGNNPDIFGTWELISYEMTDDPEDPVYQTSMTFRKDGTYSIVAFDLEEDGTYTFDGETLVLNSDLDEEQEDLKKYSVRLLQEKSVLVMVRQNMAPDDDYSRDVVFEMGYKRGAEISSDTKDLVGEWIWFMGEDPYKAVRVYLNLYEERSRLKADFIIPVWGQRYTGTATYEAGYLTITFQDYYWLNGDTPDLDYPDSNNVLVTPDFEWGPYWLDPAWKEDPDECWRWGMSYEDQITFPIIADGAAAFAYIANLCNYFEKQ